MLLFDETAAYDRVAVVEDSRLSRCGGALWLVEGEERRSVPGLPECSRCRRVAVAELGTAPDRCIQTVSGNQVQPGQRYGRRVQPVVRGQYNAAADRILGGNKHGSAQRDTQSLALSHGVVQNAPVLSQYVTGFIHIIAGQIGQTEHTCQKCRVISVRNKADVLTVALVRRDKPLACGNFPHLPLGQTAKRKECARQLFLIQAP